LAFNRLRDREIVVKIFDELGPRYANRNGGYLRILKCGFRDGDNAPLALVELLDRPEDNDDGALSATAPKPVIRLETTVPPVAPAGPEAPATAQ
jgi:hypothetical protein